MYFVHMFVRMFVGMFVELFVVKMIFETTTLCYLDATLTTLAD